MEKKLSYILFLFSTLFVSGQVTLAVSEVKDPKLNQTFNLTVLLEIKGENMEQETPLRMPDLSKFDIIGSASEQNTVVVDAKKGNVINQMVYQWVLSPKEAGRIKFGSVLVTVNGKIYKTEPFEISVRETEKKSSVADVSKSNDVYLNLEIKDKAVYKNEPTLAVLRAYSKNYGNFRKLNGIKFSSQKNINVKPVSTSKSEIETRSGMASQVVGTYVIYPAESGNYVINPVSASINASPSNKISSNSVRLSVKKLPVGAPEDFKNAVGNFNISFLKKNSEEVLELNKPINVTVQISGKGNFNTMHLPKIADSENYLVYPPKIVSNLNTSQDGLSGNVKAEYIVVPKKNGSIPLRLESFSYFDPETQQYVDVGEKSLALEVKTKDQILEGKSTIEKVNEYTNVVLETVNTPILPTASLKINTKNKMNWGAVAGNLSLLAILFGAAIFLKNKVKKKPAKPLPLKTEIGSVAQTEEEIRKNWKNRWEDSIDYLKNLNENEDFTTFFSAYEELRSETKSNLNIGSESEFKKYLEEEKGLQFADEYRKLSEKLQIEKYAPFQSSEHIDELLKTIITLYSEINK